MIFLFEQFKRIFSSLQALLEGADGVLIAGCHPGDCHYIDGNLKARRKFVLMKLILSSIGLEEDRVWLRWISASEGQKFAETVEELSEELRKMGPNPIKEHWNI